MNHSKLRPFKNRTKIDHLKSGHVRISDPHCIWVLCKSHAHGKKVLFWQFSSVFHCIQPCKHMRQHVFTGQNTVTIWIPSTRIPDSMGVRNSNGQVTWLGRPLEYQTFWTINRLFQSGFQTTFWIPNQLTLDTNLPLKYWTSPVFRWLLYTT